MIDDLSPELAAVQKRILRNRHVIAGEDAVKACRETYLPRLPSHSEQVASGCDPHGAYLSYLRSVDFFPAAARTAEGNRGLIFRKPFSFDGDDTLADIFETITPDLNLDQLARKLVDETQVTNFTILLVDHPAQPDGLSAATAIQQGYRPFLALYPFESIIGVERALSGNKRVISRVRLYDDIDTIRELRLDNGTYTVTLHHRTHNGWLVGETVTPLKSGVALNAIPVEIVTTEPGSNAPSKAPMDDLCRLNLSHYQVQAMIANTLRNIASPIRWITGVADLQNAYIVSPDQIWQFTSPDTKVGFLEHSGAGVDSLFKRADDLTDQMAAVGSRILQGDKAAAEAAETLAIRRASENSILASLALAISDQLERALNVVMEWMGAQPVTFRLNTDFLPTPMSAQEMTALLAVVQAGRMSAETFFETLKAGEIVSDTINYEDERARIEQDSVERPPVS